MSEPTQNLPAELPSSGLPEMSEEQLHAVNGPTHKEVQRLEIDPELAENLRALTEEEYLHLKRSLLEEGCREPIVLWREGGVIADGHNRYEICAANGVPFAVEYLSKGTKEEVLEWQRDNQFAKRNLTAQEVAYYRGKDYLAAKKPPGAPEGNTNATKQSGQNDHFESAAAQEKPASRSQKARHESILGAECSK